MPVVEMLSPATAGDADLVSRLSDVVNRAYAIAEVGLWTEDIPRTTDAATVQAIEQGHQAVATEGDRIVGAIRTSQLEAGAWWFGALAVDPATAGRGIGAVLVGFAEARAAHHGASVMQLELLVPEMEHAHVARLAEWYGRLGYVEVGRQELATVDPSAVPFAVVRIDAAVMRKQLTR